MKKNKFIYNQDEEKFSYWEEVDNFPNEQIFFDKLINNEEDVLELYFYFKKDSRRIKISFDWYTLLLKTEESDIFLRIGSFPVRKNYSNIFIVNNSPLLKWFLWQGTGVNDDRKDKYTHYFFAPVDCMVDVIALKPPRVHWILPVTT